MSMYFDKKCQNTCQMSIDVLNDEKIGEKQVAAGGPKNENILGHLFCQFVNGYGTSVTASIANVKDKFRNLEHSKIFLKFQILTIHCLYYSCNGFILKYCCSL